MNNDLKFPVLYTNVDEVPIIVHENGVVQIDVDDCAIIMPVAMLQKIVFRAHRYMKERSDYLNGVIK